MTDVGYLPEGWAPHEEKWWAIGSEVVMPPVGPPLIKFDHTFKNRVEREYAGDSNFREEGFDERHALLRRLGVEDGREVPFGQSVLCIATRTES